MRDSLFCFIAHIREAKSLPANLAVPWINHQMMFLPQFPGELEHVDAFVVLHAGERFRPESFLGEEIEPGPAHPVVNEPIGARVPSKTRLESFFENFVEL